MSHDKSITPTTAQIIERMRSRQRSDPPLDVRSATAEAPPVTQTLQTIRPQVVGTGIGAALQNLRNARSLGRALVPVHERVTKGLAELYELHCMARIDAARDQETHRYLLLKAEHGEVAAVAAQMYDERLLKLGHRGRDRFSTARSERLAELARQHADGLLTDQDFDRSVDETIEEFEEAVQRMRGRLRTGRSNVDALLGSTLRE